MRCAFLIDAVMHCCTHSLPHSPVRISNACDARPEIGYENLAIQRNVAKIRDGRSQRVCQEVTAICDADRQSRRTCHEQKSHNSRTN